MSKFRVTSHLTEILEHSEKEPVIIFKYSKTCSSSDVLKSEFEKKDLKHPVYIVTVQDMPNLSKKIEELFEIKHESPQVIAVNNGKVTYSMHHNNIKIEDFLV